MTPIRKVMNVARNAAALLAVSVIGAGSVHYGGVTSVTQAIWTFLGGVSGNAAFDRLQHLVYAFRERPQEKVDGNLVVLRALRRSQLKALTQLRARWDLDRARTVFDDAFNADLGAYIAAEEQTAATLTWEDMLAPEPGDPNPLADAAVFDQTLALRHGVSPALERIAAPVNAAVWAELLREFDGAIPDTFKALFDAEDGFFALFIGIVSAQLRDEPGFAHLWNAEQIATIRHLLGATAATVTDLDQQLVAATQALQWQATLLDVIAGRTEHMAGALEHIRERLFGDSVWLHFDVAVSTQGWLRFSPYNSAVPFLGRTATLAELDTFLNDDRAFAWWGITGPGGAGKTRLALELCLRARAQGWRVGLLRKHIDLGMLLGWRPSTPTLVIADYAAERIDNVKAAADILAELNDRSAPVVRLLLVERWFDDQFWRGFLGIEQLEQGRLLRGRFHESMLALPALSENDLWNLVCERPWQAPPTPLEVDRATFFVRLNEVDRDCRPLVAMLLADAPDLGGDLNDVLRRLIERSRHFWPSPMPPNADLLIAAATLLGRLEGEALNKLSRHLGRTLTTHADLRPCAKAIASGPDPNTALAVSDHVLRDFNRIRTSFRKSKT